MKCPHCQKRINIGQIIGSKRSKAKAAAAAANGAKGGRPRKQPDLSTPGGDDDKYIASTVALSAKGKASR